MSHVLEFHLLSAVSQKTIVGFRAFFGRGRRGVVFLFVVCFVFLWLLCFCCFRFVGFVNMIIVFFFEFLFDVGTWNHL